jgi:uracil phosphoribosyltransferase
MRSILATVILGISLVTTAFSKESDCKLVRKILKNRHNEKVLSELLPIVHCSFTPSKYEQILISQLRDVQTSTTQFRSVSEKIGGLLVNKVIECLPSRAVEIETPVTKCRGVVLSGRVELVSVMRSGDALLDTFIKHFPNANVSKFLVQRDESNAEAHFKYMKISPELASGNPVVITEPMIATGGSLDMVISILKDKGVKEENIIIASVCVAPEGLLHLNRKFPKIKVVMTTLDEKLNGSKYIVPGVGDFGDRFFGTPEYQIVSSESG